MAGTPLHAPTPHVGPTGTTLIRIINCWIGMNSRPLGIGQETHIFQCSQNHPHNGPQKHTSPTIRSNRPFSILLIRHPTSQNQIRIHPRSNQDSISHIQPSITFNGHLSGPQKVAFGCCFSPAGWTQLFVAPHAKGP